MCLLREDGAFPVRSHVLFEGIRFPLGVASAGLAILAFLPDDQVEAHLARADLGAYGDAHAPDRVRDRVAHTRRAGVAVNPGYSSRAASGWAQPSSTRARAPPGTLAHRHRGALSRERQPELARLLLEHAHRLTPRAAGRRGAPRTPADR